MRILLLSLMATSTAAYAVPTQLGHQGRLLDVDGIPLEGLVSLEFQIYDSLEDGTVLWSEFHDVELINGYYSLVLGADELDNPLEDTLFEEDELYLELTVDDDEELEPRQALNAVPYARLAGTATNVSGGFVDASEIRVGGTTVVDSSGTWVSSTPDVDWSDLSGIPAGFSDGEDANTQLSESEVDAFTDNNGYATTADLEDAVVSISYEDLVDVPEVIPGVGVNAVHFSEDGSFTVPAATTSLIVYVTGGGGGGSNGETTALELGTHSHAVSAHNHAGGASHAHAAGSHTHSGGSHTHSESGLVCGSSSCGGSVCGHGTVATGAASGSSGAATGGTSSADIGTTASTGLTTDGSGVSGGTVITTGGNGGSGGGMNVLLTVSPGAECEISIGTAGDVAGAGTSTTVSCDDQRVECGGGSAGNSDGVSGDDGVCTVTGGTRLSEYKASRFAPGGGGSGGNGSGAAAGQAGTVTIRY